MRYLVPLVALVASTGVASPASTINRDVAGLNVTSLDATTRDVTPVDKMTDAIAFAASQKNCDALKCAAVIVAAAGIDICIVIGGPAAVPCVLGCVVGGASAICPCADCNKKLDQFLEKEGVCPRNEKQ